MKNVKLFTVLGLLAVLLAAITIPAACAASKASDKAEKTLTLEDINAKELPALSAAIDKAMKAVESGDKETALEQLQKASKLTTVITEVVKKEATPQFANVRCPIMGSPINPEHVADNLVREFKGEKVAFCCGGCPARWDKMTDAEKQEALDKVRE
ncbi:MAG: hypothetical protein ACIAQZ_08680 [Sedimentisphaeraceae bacterium JB056]